jgi:serine/threonine protein kinase
MQYIATLPSLRILGRGSFGEVHLCKDMAHGPVAAKFFFRANFSSPAEWSKACVAALAEAQSMKALEHRNVVPIYQVLMGPKDDTFVIIMQFCDGGSIKSVAESNRIILTDSKRIIRDAGIGLCYIHNKGFLHRDIKPENIFRTSAGELKIGDFGFVTDKLIFGFAGGCGTPEYVAPEVMATSQCSVLTDIYSLGVTFLHLIHGDFWFFRSGKHSLLKEVPFNGQIWRVLSDDYIFLPHIPVEWRNTIKRMTHPNPIKRHQSMEEAVDAISRLPVVENWQCEVVAPDLVSWVLVKGARRVRVEWRDYLSKTESWVAWSEDMAGGRKKTLGKSNAVDTPIKRYRALQTYFSDRAP